jgi:hypothetical protein
MPEPTKLIYPTLDLFLYDIREALGQDTQKIDENRQNFWQRIYIDSQNNFQIKELQEERLLAKLKEAEKSETGFTELLGSDRVKHFERPLEGFYYPVLIGDTYALQVDCSGVYTDGMRQSNYKPQPLENLQNIKAEILSHINHQPGTIGQTWMMWGQFTDIHQNPTQIALECYKQLVPEPHNWERDLKAKGQFLGGTIFELWRPPSDWSDREQLKDNYHLLIWLFPPTQSINAIGDSIARIYLDLIHLFCFRNKVLWTYGQSCQLKAEIKADAAAIQNTIRDVSQMPQQKKASEVQMKQLRKILSTSLTLLSRHAVNLSDLNVLGRTIEINLENYIKRLKKMEKLDPGSDLQFLAEFGKLATTKYLRQVEMEHSSHTYGLTLLENLIRTVEGMTSTYQAQSERALNSTLAAVGVGLATSAALATGAVASSALITQSREGRDIVSFQATAFGISLLVGAIASLIVWKLLRR